MCVWWPMSNTVENRLQHLDGWRGLAILSVLVGHFVTTKWLNLGRFGVELFFVLSGRLMAEILFVKQVPLASFFPRRISRVYPALLVFCTIMFLAAPLLNGQGPDLKQYLSAITFTANYAQGLVGRSPALDHIWSLCVEEHMYVLLGLVALWSRSRDGEVPVATICFGLALAAMVNGLLQTLAGGGYNEVYWRSDVRGASILLAAAFYLKLREEPTGLLASPWAALVLGALGLVFSFDKVPDPVKYSLGTACVALSLCLAHRLPAVLLNLLQHPILIRTGLYSYSLYLWQQPFYKAGHNAVSKLALLPIAIVVALVSFYLIEQPARRFLNGLLERRLKPAPAAG
ncbi:acyltransferase [Caulobacter sp. D5]|uniref:acyltransferase family protein n=1 Tax=Caulobacter sp. D5 TaxID=357400 RepID=UPI000D732D47|nr:acyltransferase [Caulobacter sp. D5]